MCPVFGYRYIGDGGMKYPGCVFSLFGKKPLRESMQKYVAFLSISAISSVTNAIPLMHGRVNSRTRYYSTPKYSKTV